jgi:hypothetical protein
MKLEVQQRGSGRSASSLARVRSSEVIEEKRHDELVDLHHVVLAGAEHAGHHIIRRARRQPWCLATLNMYYFGKRR